MEEAQLKEKLIVLSRMLSREGFFEGFGHVSVRIPQKDYYYVTHGDPISKSDFEVKDLVCVDFKGNKLEGECLPPLESIIHTAFHRSRDDAVCVVHVHPYYSRLLAIAGIDFQPVTLQAAPLGYNLPVYEPAELIITEAQGERLVRVTGTAKAVLLRGHGVVTIGDSIEEAFYLTFYLEESAQLLLDATRLGKVIPLSHEEIPKSKYLDLARGDPSFSPYAKVWAYHEFITRTGH